MLFECRYHTKGKRDFHTRQFAANNYANALNHIFILHSRGRLSVPFSSELKIEYLKKIEG